MSNKSYKNLLNQIKEIEIIDTHEHIRNQKTMKTEIINLFRLFENSYCRFDFISAGMNEKLWECEPENIWPIWKKYQENVQFTSSFKNIIRALKGLYGLKDDIITKKNWKILSEKIRYFYQNEDWYKYVLSKKANFSISLLDNYWSIEKMNFDSQLFLPVLRTNPFILGRNFIPKYTVKRKVPLTRVEDIARE